MTTLEKFIDRYIRNIPVDRWLRAKADFPKLAKEIIALRAEMDQTDAERNALIDLVEEQRAEIEAFKASGAASMETHNTEET